MRFTYLLVSFLLVLGLTACGSEDLMIPPVFSNIAVSGTSGSTTILTNPSKDLDVTISGNIDDNSTIIIANSTVTGEIPVSIIPITDTNAGSWSFTFTPTEVVNAVTFTASDRRGNINQLYLTFIHDTTPPEVVANGVTQDLTDPLSPKLIVTFNEALLESSVTADPFAVDGLPVTGATLETVVTNLIVTLPLSAALPAGEHILTCPGVTDIATPDGNSVTVDYSLRFTIAPIVE